MGWNGLSAKSLFSSYWDKFGSRREAIVLRSTSFPDGLKSTRGLKTPRAFYDAFYMLDIFSESVLSYGYKKRLNENACMKAFVLNNILI